MRTSNTESNPQRAAAILVLIAVVIASAGLTARAPSPPATSPAFDAMFEQYLHGDADAAVRAFAAWPETRVIAEVPADAAGADPWQQAALALLHTEAGLLNETFFARQFGQKPLGGNRPLEAHAASAVAIVSRLATAKEPQDPALRRVCVDWLVFAAAFENRTQWRVGPPYLEPAIRVVDDSKLRLASGSDAEQRMGHLPDEPPNAMGVPEGDQLVSNSKGVFNATRARFAERDLRQSLQLDDSLTEARLRVGRLNYLVGSPKESLAFLERASEESRAKSLRWEGDVADLFLAEFHATDKRDDLAADAYHRAIENDPAAQPAYFGLSDLLLTQGAARDAWAQIDRLFAAQKEAGRLWNPWSLYDFAQFHDARERLNAMRSAIAQHFGRTRQSNVPFQYLAAPPPLVKMPPQEAPTRSATGRDALDNSRTGQFRTDVEGVRIDVTVRSGSEPVLGLTASDFAVYDNDEPQSVESAATTPGLSIALALDVSHDNRKQLDLLVRAASRIASGIHSSDRVSVVTISDELNLEVRNESSSPRLISLLAGLQLKRYGCTALWDGAYAATALAASTESRPYVVLFGDNLRTGAGDNASWLSNAQILDSLRASGAVVDAVWNPRGPSDRYRPDRGYWTSDDVVYGMGWGDKLVDATGGKTFSSEAPDLEAQLHARLNELRQSYVLTYTPTNVARGGWHKITVKLKDKRGKIQARPGYYSPRK